MKTIKQAKSKNQIKNTKLFSVLFFLFIVLTSCQQEIYDIEEEGDFLIENSQNKKVNTVKIWFESNPKYNNFQILRYTKRIDWGKAKSFNNGKVNAIEIPLILKDNFKLTPKNSSSINSINRLLITKNKNGELNSFIVNFSSLNKSESFLRNFSALNYLNISEEYVGTITLINHKNKIVSLNKFKKDKFDNIYDEKTARKEAVVSCWEIVELFDDGSVRHTGIIYCYQGGGGNIDDGSETPTYPHGGGGGEPSEETFDDQIDTANLDSCSKAILEAIQNGNSIEDIINQFAGEDSQFSWSLVTNDGSNFENSENLAETNWNNATANSYITEIKSSYSSSATRLSIARTIVHEAIHAYILSYIDIAAQGNSSASYSEFPDLWNQLVAKKYGDPNTTSGWNQYHHEEMARNYVTTIANALAIWDNNQNSSQYYTDLAWGGLFETEIFNQTSDLTAEDRERIAESNRSEDLNNSNAQGNPCN